MSIRLTLALWMLPFAAFALTAPDPKELGTKIASDAQTQNEGFVGERASMKMILVDAHGTRTERDMEGKVLEVKSDGDKSLSVFLNPLDVKGTKMLTWSHKNDDDDQWLFLPTMKRVKRISSSNQSASFMGSEFSYEDLGSQEIEKFDYLWLRDEKLDGEDVWVLERRPKKKSGYSKQVIWMSKKFLGPLKMEYYDRKEQLLKTATFKDYQASIVGKKTLWRCREIDMKNVQTNKQSTFTWSKREVGVAFKESEFDQSILN